MSDSFDDTDNLRGRLKSYIGWTSAKCYVELSLAGYRYTGQLDRVQCDYCNKKVVQWTVNDNALEVHARFDPDCIFLKHIGYSRNLPIPRFTHFCKYSDRLESVRTVDEQFSRNLPPLAKIAEAGFFYQGTLDRMVCYHCGLILRDWERDTDPIATHKRFKSSCLYVTRLSNIYAGQNIPLVRDEEQPSMEVLLQNERSCTSRIGKFIQESGGNWHEQHGPSSSLTNGVDRHSTN
ncbi:hypothetical protein SNE40_008819 [Patella caerulea]|uniref:Uncharacterized protein n=1 Tax=Patella caerulea TaxID=87958 RepID=A0AAN8Q266_PATCE